MKKTSLYGIIFALSLCLISKSTLAQWVPDPGNLYGPGTTTRTTTSTNSETMISETKTEYKDASGITRQESINTKDHDGNDVLKEKIYDKTGKLQEEHEDVRDPNSGRLIRVEYKVYDSNGRVTKAAKWVRENGKDYYFDFDYIKQQYKDPKIVSSVSQKGDEIFVCNASKFNLGIGYSYLQTNVGNPKSFPLGIDLSLGYRFDKNFRGIFDLGVYNSNKNDQNVQRTFILPGIEYHPRKEEPRPISVFGRIAIGMMHERYKAKQQEATKANGFACDAGLGAEFKIGCKTAIRTSADYVATFINEDIIHGFRFGAGLTIDLDDRFARSRK